MFSHPVALVLALVLAASSAAMAQNAPAPAGAAPPPAREGNIYDHKDHQPTEADLPAVDRSGASQSEVEKGVQQLLRQTDELDKQSEQDERLPPEPK